MPRLKPNLVKRQLNLKERTWPVRKDCEEHQARGRGVYQVQL